MSDIKARIQSQFDKVASNYRTSRVHAAGEDLKRFGELLADRSVISALDVGCGAGHTSAAVAPYAERVTAVDITAGMLQQTEALCAERGITNVQVQVGDVLELPFEQEYFDAIVTRYSAHHWANPEQAVRECWRVLKPGGIFILSDVIGLENYADDTFLQAIELLRDSSHVRDFTIPQWQTMIEAADFAYRLDYSWQIDLDFEAWTARMAVPPEKVTMIRQLFDEANDSVRAALAIEANHNFKLPCALFVGQKA